MNRPYLFATLIITLLALGSLRGLSQEYTVKAVDDTNGKPLTGMPITLRYACTYDGSGLSLKVKCKFLQRKTGPDGLAHFPKAGSLKDIDDIFSLPIWYGVTCCDISKPEIPGVGIMKFHKRSFAEAMHWIFVGD